MNFEYISLNAAVQEFIAFITEHPFLAVDAHCQAAQIYGRVPWEEALRHASAPRAYFTHVNALNTLYKCPIPSSELNYVLLNTILAHMALLNGSVRACARSITHKPSGELKAELHAVVDYAPLYKCQDFYLSLIKGVPTEYSRSHTFSSPLTAIARATQPEMIYDDEASPLLSRIVTIFNLIYLSGIIGSIVYIARATPPGGYFDTTPYLFCALVITAIASAVHFWIANHYEYVCGGLNFTKKLLLETTLKQLSAEKSIYGSRHEMAAWGAVGALQLYSSKYSKINWGAIPPRSVIGYALFKQRSSSQDTEECISRESEGLDTPPILN